MRAGLTLLAVTGIYLALAWPDLRDDMFGRTEGAACTVLGDRDGVIFGGNCRPFDAGHIRVALSEETDLSGLGQFPSLEAVTIQFRDQPVDLTVLMLHPELRSVTIMGPHVREGEALSGADLDLSPLVGLQSLRAVELVNLADVDLQPLEDIDGLTALRLLNIRTGDLPDFGALDVTHLALWLVDPVESIGPLDTVVVLELWDMPSLIADLAERFPNLERIKVTGETFEDGVLLRSLEQMPQVSEVEVGLLDGESVRGREGAILFLQESGE